MYSQGNTLFEREHRAVTNGQRFRVQRRFRLFRLKTQWSFVQSDDSLDMVSDYRPIEFSTRNKAEQWIDEIENGERWTPCAGDPT